MRYTRGTSISGTFDVREHERERERERVTAFINRRSELFEEFQTMKGTRNVTAAQIASGEAAQDAALFFHLFLVTRVRSCNFFVNTCALPPCRTSRKFRKIEGIVPRSVTIFSSLYRNIRKYSLGHILQILSSTREYRAALKITIDLTDFLLPNQRETHWSPIWLSYVSKLQVWSSYFYSHTCYFVRSHSGWIALRKRLTAASSRVIRVSRGRFKFIRAHASLPAWEHRCWQLRAFDNDGTVRNSEPAKQLREPRGNLSLSVVVYSPTRPHFGGNKTFSQGAIKVTFLSAFAGRHVSSDNSSTLE